MPRAAWLAFLAIAATVVEGDDVDAVGRPPVFLVPGITGSAMEVRMTGAQMPHRLCKGDTNGKWDVIWIQPGGMLPYEIDCLIARLTLTYDPSQDTYSNLPGVELQPVEFGSTKTGDFLYTHEFGPLMEHLGWELGYKNGTDLFVAPYDWRLAGDGHATSGKGVGGFYGRFQQLIEMTVQKLGSRAVVVSHSLGCPTMLYFFHNYVSAAWRKKYIRSWLAVSGAWLGSSMQLNAYLSGYTFGMPSWLVPHDYVKSVQVNASSGVWLSPSPMAFGDMTIVSTPSKNYTAADLPIMLEALGNEQALSIFKKASMDLSVLQTAPANVPVDHWYATGEKTAISFAYDKDLSHGFNEAPTSTSYGDGDGTVDLVSLQSVERFWGASASTRVFPGTSHFGMLSDARMLGNLTDYLVARGASTSVTLV